MCTYRTGGISALDTQTHRTKTNTTEAAAAGAGEEIIILEMREGKTRSRDGVRREEAKGISTFTGRPKWPIDGGWHGAAVRFRVISSKKMCECDLT